MVKLIVAIAVLPALLYAAPVVGKVRMTLGDVTRWKVKQNDWTALKPGAKLYQSDKVRTGVESEVVFGFPDGSSISIAEKTEVELVNLFEPNDEGGFETHIDIHKGFLNFAVHKLKDKKSNFKFKTGTATASIRGTEGFIGGEGVFFAGLKTGKLEITPQGSDKAVSIGAGETTFGKDSLVVVKLASSGDARFAKKLERILADKSKSMKDLQVEVQKADSTFQEQLKEEAKNAEALLPKNGFMLSTTSPVQVCENGLTVEGTYRTADTAASLVVKVGSYTSGNLIHAADGNAHPFTEEISINDENGLWLANKAVVEFKNGALSSSRSIDLQVNRACAEVNTKAPTLTFASYDSLHCNANVSVGEMRGDAAILVASSDGSPILEEAITKNAQKKLKLQKGRHEYVVRIEDQAGNVAELSKTMGCFPKKRFPIEVFGPSKEVLKVPPPPKDVEDRIVQTLQFRVKIPENDPEYLYKVTVRQNGKVILQETLSQIRNLDYQVPVSLMRGGVNHIDIEVVHKSGYVSKGRKDYEVR